MLVGGRAERHGPRGNGQHVNERAEKCRSYRLPRPALAPESSRLPLRRPDGDCLIELSPRTARADLPLVAIRIPVTSASRASFGPLPRFGTNLFRPSSRLVRGCCRAKCVALLEGSFAPGMTPIGAGRRLHRVRLEYSGGLEDRGRVANGLPGFRTQSDARLSELTKTPSAEIRKRAEHLGRRATIQPHCQYMSVDAGTSGWRARGLHLRDTVRADSCGGRLLGVRCMEQGQ